MFSVPQAVSDKKSNSLYTLLRMKTTKGCKTPGYLITVRKHKWGHFENGEAGPKLNHTHQTTKLKLISCFLVYNVSFTASLGFLTTFST